MIDQAEKLRRIVNNLNKNLPKTDVINISVQDKEKAVNNNVLILEEKSVGEDSSTSNQVDKQVDNQVGTSNEYQANIHSSTKVEMDTSNNTQNKPANTPTAHKAKVITITSGKGGVGKTSITANLALSLSQKGYRVIIVDADLGLSNIDVVFGIVPRYSLLELIKNEKGILDILCDGPNNIKFLSGGSGVKELVNLDQNSLDSFIANMSLLDHIADFILIDTGAGLSDTVLILCCLQMKLFSL